MTYMILRKLRKIYKIIRIKVNEIKLGSIRRGYRQKIEENSVTDDCKELLSLGKG